MIEHRVCLTGHGEEAKNTTEREIVFHLRDMHLDLVWSETEDKF